MTYEPVYTILSNVEDGEIPTVNELKSKLEKGSDNEKILCMKQLITLILNGDPCEQLLMHVIRFIMPSRNKQLKKLLLLYWEVCPKYNTDGKLKQEMILVCNAIRNDVQHPNEFIRGATLRFLCKLREPELLEPLIPTCRSCLEHRLSYVRKNAVIAIHSIYKHQPNLIPDAPELIQSFLAAESDSTCKRNAFVMLSSTAPELATTYVKSFYDQIIAFDELVQLAIIEHIRKDAPRYIRVIVDLLSASSPSVKYEAATSLTLLTSNSAALKAAAACYLELALKESDNNVKLIVLDRFESLNSKHGGVFSELAMDALRILGSSPDLDVRAKVLNVVKTLTSKRNVNEVLNYLQKELTRTHDQQYEKNSEYRELLVQAIHGCAIRFPEVAANVVHLLMAFLSEGSSANSSGSASVDVITFVREVAEKFPDLRNNIIISLLDAFPAIKLSRALRGALWILGEYCSDVETIELSWAKIRESIGDIPIVASEQQLLESLQVQTEPNGSTTASPTVTAKKLNADGTYATESYIGTKADMTIGLEALKGTVRPPIRALLMKGDYYIGTILASTLAKIVFRFEELSQDKSRANGLRAEAMLIMTSVIRLGQSQFTQAPIDDDSIDRIMVNIKLLAANKQDSQLEQAYGKDSRQAFTTLLQNRKTKESKDTKVNEGSKSKVEVDDLVDFRLLSNKNTDTGSNEYALDLTRATGELELSENLATKLDRIISLSGYSDAIYCEAVVEVHQYDILLDILLVNQTDETLQNVTLDFATLGDLRLVEKPAPTTLAPNAFHSTKASVKVASTETGVVFGNLTYDQAGSSSEGASYIVLNDIHVDIMDYIHPATCALHQFRAMWTEFEWENKVNVHTPLTDLQQFLEVVLKVTNMAPLNQVNFDDECNFLSVNLYAKTIFGEDALANLSIEKAEETGSIVGHVRIRSKAQGLALSLGDKVTLAQKV